MADFDYASRPPKIIQRIEPELLSQRFTDGSELRRQVPGTAYRRFIETHRFDTATAATVLAFLYSKGLNTPFTIKTDDPNDAAGAETTVRLERPPEVRVLYPNQVEIRLTFIELPQE